MRVNSRSRLVLEWLIKISLQFRRKTDQFRDPRIARRDVRLLRPVLDTERAFVRRGVADVERTPFQRMPEAAEPFEVGRSGGLFHLRDRIGHGPLVFRNQFILELGVVDAQRPGQVRSELFVHLSLCLRRFRI